MIEELQQEIAKLKQKLKNVQNQLLEVMEAAADRDYQHALNWWYETDGDPATEPSGGINVEDYMACKDCGRVMSIMELHHHYCEDGLNNQTK